MRSSEGTYPDQTLTRSQEFAEQARELFESEQRFRATFEQAGIGLAHVAADGKWIRLNQRFCEIVGYSLSELRNLTFQDITHPDDIAEDLRNVARMLAGEIDEYKMDKRYLRKDGQIIWVTLNVSLIRNVDGTPKYFVSAVNDISDKKKAEEERKAALRELTRSNQDLEQFAYLASHDLKEPLRMVSAYITLLQRQYGSVLDENGRESLGFVLDGVARMNSLIDSLLTFARIESHPREMGKVDCNSVVEKVLADLRIRIDETSAKVTIEQLPVVQGEPAQLYQVFLNLISNSLKFCVNRTPEITISCLLRDKEWLFSVKDNGIGLEMGQADKIFELFKRLHGRTDFEGSGIGLAICRKIVERHGGRMWVESKAGDGSTFFFTVPERVK